MALHKDVIDPVTLAVAGYWRITSADSIHAQPAAVHVVLSGYVSQVAREAGAAPVATRFFRLVLGDFAGAADLHAVSTEQIYDALKGRVAAPAAPALGAPLSPSDAVSSARAPVMPDALAGAVDA